MHTITNKSNEGVEVRSFASHECLALAIRRPNGPYARPQRHGSLHRLNFESPRNGKRKMRYLAYTKRIQYPEKKRIRTRLSTCKYSCYSSLQPIRFVEKL